MLFKVQFNHINYLLLIPSLWLASDFLPLWFIYTITCQLILITFFKVHRYLGNLNFILVYFIFQSVGRQIIPETMIPILASFLMAQITYNKAIERDESFLFFLWIGIFSVFSASFSYLLYTAVVLIYYFVQQTTNEGLSIKNTLKAIFNQRWQLFFTAILAIIMFIFFPRFYNFLPSANNIPQGEIGYTGNISNTTNSNLNLSNKTAFYAEIKPALSQELLYWRGRVNAHTDGYNWSSTRVRPVLRDKIKSKPQKLIKAKLKYEQNFEGDVILLDKPYEVTKSNFRTYKIPQTNEFKFYRKKKKATIETLSTREQIESDILKKENKQQYLQLPNFIPKAVKQIHQQIKSDNPQELILKFKQYLIKEGYSYTLKPGPLPTIRNFIKAKKGFCTHYSSLLGVLLRLNKTPTRLISGFQGGLYNKVGNFYEIKSNDAHAWVEYHDGASWRRVDPTSFISPDRINFGGDTFLNAGSEILTKERNQSIFAKYANTIKLEWENLNYKVSLFFDNFNREKQRELSKVLNINHKLFLTLGFVLVGLIIGIYMYITRYRQRVDIHPCDKELIILSKKLKIEPSLNTYKTIEQMKAAIKQNNHANEKALEILEIYQLSKYAQSHKLQDLQTKVREFKPQK